MHVQVHDRRVCVLYSMVCGGNYESLYTCLLHTCINLHLQYSIPDSGAAVLIVHVELVVAV